jgi:hypothetical protein
MARHTVKPIDEMTLEEAKAALHRVYDVGLRAKREQDWCDDGFREALREIGIPEPGDKVRFLTIRMKVKYSPESEYADSDWTYMVEDLVQDQNLRDEEGDEVEIAEVEVTSVDDADTPPKTVDSPVSNPPYPQYSRGAW